MKDGYNPQVEICYFCSGTRLQQHSKATYWKKFDLNFVECANCRLIFANPMPDVETIIKGNQALNIHHGSRGTLSQYRGGKEFASFLETIKPKGNFLDVGCAEGFFLTGIQENSTWKAEGIEIIASAVEFASKRLGLTVHNGTLEHLKSQAHSYDFIRMNNVIEHVQNPLIFLRTAYNLLKKSGRVYCSTPNGFQDGNLLKTANKRGFKINLLENHFFYYHPKTLIALFKTCGFKILKSFCEDTSHSLNDFGLLPWFKYPHETQNFSLTSFQGQTNKKLNISDDEIRSFKNNPTLNSRRLKINKQIKRLTRIHFPAFLAIGHQQHLFAEK